VIQIRFKESRIFVIAQLHKYKIIVFLLCGLFKGVLHCWQNGVSIKLIRKGRKANIILKSVLSD